MDNRRRMSPSRSPVKPMTDRRPLLRAIFDAAVAAAHPDVVLSAHLRPAPKGRVICLAAGKGAAAMAAAAERHYLDALELDPERLVGRRDHPPRPWRADAADQGDRSRSSGARRGRAEGRGESLQLAQSAGADDLLLVLLSGGGSANWIAPADGVSFAQKQQVTRALLRSGAPIGEVNTRSQAPVADQGRPARARRPARRDRDAGDLGRSARRSLRDRVGTDGAGSDHACGCARHRREIRPRRSTTPSAARSTTQATRAASPAMTPLRARNSS